MLDSRIKFDERYDSDYGTTFLYFIAPKEMIKTFFMNDYPDAVSMEISIEFPTNKIEAIYGECCVSPTVEVDCGMEDIDWLDVDLPYEEIEELINLAKGLTIDDVVRRLNDGLDRTEEELEMCKNWLIEYQLANDLSIKDLDDLCFDDSVWVFEQIF